MKKSLHIRPLIAALSVLVALGAGVLVGVLATSSSGGSTTFAPSVEPDPDGIAPLVGAWRMTELETTVDGVMAPVPYIGQISFDSSGLVSVQAMNPDTGAADGPYTVGGYEAWTGQANVDQGAGTFTATVDTAVVRDLIGQELTRVFEVSDDTLVLQPADPSEGWRVTYERF